MRFCTVVRSHASCNFLWYLRDQIIHTILPANLVLGLRAYRWFTKVLFYFPGISCTAGILLCLRILISLQLTKLSWVFPGPPGTNKVSRMSHCWFGILGCKTCLGCLGSFVFLGIDLVFRYRFDSLCFWFTRDLDISQLSAVGSGVIWYRGLLPHWYHPFYL